MLRVLSRTCSALLFLDGLEDLHRDLVKLALLQAIWPIWPTGTPSPLGSLHRSANPKWVVYANAPSAGPRRYWRYLSRLYTPGGDSRTPRLVSADAQTSPSAGRITASNPWRTGRSHAAWPRPSSCAVSCSMSCRTGSPHRHTAWLATRPRKANITRIRNPALRPAVLKQPRCARTTKPRSHQTSPCANHVPCCVQPSAHRRKIFRRGQKPSITSTAEGAGPLTNRPVTCHVKTTSCIRRTWVRQPVLVHVQRRTKRNDTETHSFVCILTVHAVAYRATCAPSSPAP